MSLTEKRKAAPGDRTAGDSPARDGQSRNQLHPQYSVGYPICQGFSRTAPPSSPEGRAPLGIIAPVMGEGGLILVGGQHLCRVRGDTLYRTFDGSRELLRGCLAFRVDVLKLASEHGAKRIVATERASGQVFTVSMREFHDFGWRYSHAKFGEQHALALAKWHSDAPSPDPVPAGPQQLALFDLAVRHA